jgi:hypothetical protein
MKKALALLLSVLVALSMFSVAAFATEGLVKITFLADDGTTIKKVLEVNPGAIFTGDIPANPEAPVNPEEGYEYTFAGWRSSLDDKLYYEGTMNPASEDVTYTAEFTSKKVKETQSFFKFLESIFERINLIFQYFAEIFRFD